MEQQCNDARSTSTTPERRPAAISEENWHENVSQRPGAFEQLPDALYDSPRMVAQRAQIAAAFGPGTVRQLQKADAEAYIALNSLAIASTRDSVQAYVTAKGNPIAHRKGLWEAWNLDSTARWAIADPGDLGALGGTTNAKQVAEAIGGYNSDEDEAMDAPKHSSLRKQISDFTGTEIASSISKQDYRDNTTRVSFGSYGFTSTGSSNLISGKGFNTAQSEYKNVFSTVGVQTGGDKATATLLLDGLTDIPKFIVSLAPFNEDTKNKIQFVLSLLINEIIGRSTSNLPEIVAMLQKTIDQDDNELFRRFKDHALLIPNAKDHKGTGGQQLSRIGHGNLDSSKLDSTLTGLLESNRNLFTAMREASASKDEDELLVKLQPLLKAFAANIKSNVKFT